MSGDPDFPTIVELYIGHLAYRGLRRQDSKQMMVLSIGMILLFGVAYGISVIGTLLLKLRVLLLPSRLLPVGGASHAVRWTRVYRLLPIRRAESQKMRSPNGT